MKRFLKWIQDSMNQKGLLKVLISSSINLLIYGILLVTISSIPQGTAMTIDMYFGGGAIVWINLLLLHFLLFFLALIMSSYPTYIFNVFFAKEEDLMWKRESLGIIYFTGDIEHSPIKDLESKIRKFQGGALILFYPLILIGTYHVNAYNGLISKTLLFGSSIMFLSFVFLWGVYEKLNLFKGFKKVLKSIGRNKLIVWIMLLFLIPLVLLVIVVKWLNFGLLVLVVELIYSYCLFVIFILIRENRSLFFPGEYKVYLQFLRVMGMIVLGVFIFTNLNLEFAMLVNPTNQLLIFLISIYTVVVYMFKWFLFAKYRAKDKNEVNAKDEKFEQSFHLLRYWSMVTFLCVWTVVKFQNGSSLHDLQLVSTENAKIYSIDQHVEAFNPSPLDSINPGQKKRPILYAAYGGGLKANFWNSLLLDNIGNDFIRENVLAMSGVSGGGVGVGNFIAKEYGLLKGRITNNNKITDVIGGSNILGIEMPWFYGYDLLRIMLPDTWYDGHDRSNRSMSYYSEIFYKSDALVDSISFLAVYDDLIKHFGYFPNLIINSTATTDKYGVVSAVQGNNLFPGSIDLLDHDLTPNKSLTYFEAVSTCNRFPIISPRATVPHKGHFVDGGYFENSGIVSLLSYYDGIDTAQQNKLGKPIIVSIRNDLNNYLQGLLIDNGLQYLLTDYQLKTVEGINELSVVLNTVSGTDKMPTYLRGVLQEKMDEEFDRIFIDLPYYIDSTDIKSYFVGELDRVEFEKVWSIVDNSNDNILKCLDSVGYKYKDIGIYNPPTARMLSQPVVTYMKAMMKMESIQSRIEQIKQVNQ